MKATIGTLLAILFSIIMSAVLAGFMSGCSAREETADAELPYACESGEPIEPPSGACLLVTGEFRLGGESRGACHDVWDVLHEAIVRCPMVVSGEYEAAVIDCEE